VFSNEKGAFLLDVACLDDVCELAQLNSSVKLDMTHFETVLSRAASGFARRGGFFEVMGKDALRRCLEDERSVIFVLRDVSDGAAKGGGSIVASLWMSLHDLGFVPLSPGFADYIDEHIALRSALAQSKVCYGRELIVSRDAPRFINPSRAIFYGAFRAMKKAGFDYALSEVYRVVGYRVGTDVFAVDVVNEAAARAVAEVKGFHIAENVLRTLDFDEGLSVTIEPLAMLFDFKVTLRALEGWLRKQKIVTRFSAR
jgi:hypothetical protein